MKEVRRIEMPKIYGVSGKQKTAKFDENFWN